VPPIIRCAVSYASQLLDDAPGAVVIAVSILTLFIGAEAVKRVTGVPTEWTRKATHLGSGVVVLSLPWMLDHTVSVVVQVFAFAALLIAGRLSGLLSSIHDVERSTGGAYFYPFAVLLCWLLADGDPLQYTLPLAIMATADTGAALVGQRHGQTTYAVLDGSRSVEGSLAFFSLAFALTLGGCAIAGRPGWPDQLLVALVVATLTTAVEAISVRGSDNLLIPYFAWLALDQTLRLGLDQLGDWVGSMAIGLAVVFATSWRGSLTTAGGVGVFLVITLAGALGGLSWLGPPLTLWALALAGAPTATRAELDGVFPTTVVSIGVLLAYAHTNDPSWYAVYAATVAGATAITGALIAGGSAVQRVGVGVAATAVCSLLLPAPAALVWSAAVIALGCFLTVERTGLQGRRILATSLSALWAWVLWA